MAKTDNANNAPEEPIPAGHTDPAARWQARGWGLALTALGVVYGDIGTSPLYALRECFRGTHALSPTADNILGVLSLVFWSLVLVISLKYLMFVLRADNRGEGGILALMVLVTGRRTGKVAACLTALGVFGAALLYGDGTITPAISVLSAVEGLNQATTVFQPYVVPIALAILVALFMFQHRGTARVGMVFGPVMLMWFATIAALGLAAILREPRVLEAVLPQHAVDCFRRNGWHAYAVLGTVFLVVTGGEALYADLGHFGRKPIRRGWFAVALPALMLNYFGQGAFLLRSPEATQNLFYQLAPSWMLYPLVILATAATVIASQAIVTGAFSLARQATQLGFWPRLAIVHTSSHTIGQVYVPAVNWALLAGTVGLVLGFRESSNLAAAYGIAVSATMLITTILIVSSARRLWPSRWTTLLLPVGLGFVLIDLAFLTSNCHKILSGGWVALAFAAMIYTLMATWRHGRTILRERLAAQNLPIDLFVRDIAEHPPARVPGTAVFLSGNWGVIPRALLHNYKHNHVLHEHTVLLAVKTEEIPYVPQEQRLDIEAHGEGMYSIRVKYGFSQDPDIPKALRRAHIPDLRFDLANTTYFLGKETLVLGKHRTIFTWRKMLFSFMSRNALDPTLFFRLPPGRVVELGVQLDL